MLLKDAAAAFKTELTKSLGVPANDVGTRVAGRRQELRDRPWRRGDRRDHQLHQHLQPLGAGRRRPGGAQGARARAEAEAVGEDLAGARLAGGDRVSRQGRADRRTSTRSASTRSAMAAPPASAIPARSTTRSPTRSRTTSWSRCRCCPATATSRAACIPNVRANYLAIPPLVVAYALLGTMNEDITTAPLGTGQDGKPVYLQDIWPTNKEIADVVGASLSRAQFLKRYGEVFKGPKQWQAIEVEGGTDTYRWSDGSTYVKNPPYFEGITMEPAAGRRHHRRAHPGACSATASPPTTSAPPATSRRPRRPASICWSTRSPQTRLQQLRRAPRQPRGHDARHLRQYPHQERDGARRRRRRDQAPSRPASEMPIYDAAMRYKAEGVPLVVFGGKEYGTGSSRDWAAKGTHAARREGGDRRELRAHPPLQPGRHGRAAADRSRRAWTARRWG